MNIWFKINTQDWFYFRGFSFPLNCLKWCDAIDLSLWAEEMLLDDIDLLRCVCVCVRGYHCTNSYIIFLKKLLVTFYNNNILLQFQKKTNTRGTCKTRIFIFHKKCTVWIEIWSPHLYLFNTLRLDLSILSLYLYPLSLSSNLCLCSLSLSLCPAHSPLSLSLSLSLSYVSTWWITLFWEYIEV